MPNNKKTNLGKICFYFNLVVFIYFFQLIILFNLKIDNQFTSFIRELFTIPFLLGGFVLLILSLMAFKSDKYSITKYSFWAVVVIVLNISMIVLTFN